ncbi:F-box domain-containing protein [Mycena venus]|uniref:F-box domain-containing protein n=1 Tax=Mycena venus TaxID=2733690 RepID=A0A8H6XAE4_9AGAR|nr:F-box domain-containing protein [Mycena venus]
MSTSQSCGSPCSFQYALKKKAGLLVSPYPDLLSSAAGPPSDLQVLEICSEIARVESDISTTNTHIARLQGAMERLVRYRAELEDFVKSHRTVISVLRRLPSEILLEIFEHCVDPLIPLDPRCNAPWIISQVCSRWRAVALSSPLLWRHFVLVDWRDGNPQSQLRRLSELQLERARHAPLSIRFTLQRTIDVLELFLAVSAQWEDAALALSPEGFRHFFDHGGKFWALKRLSLSSWEPIPDTHSVDLRESFPVLQDLKLELYNEDFPRRLLLPWSQLRTCALSDIHSVELLWIASQLSPGSEVSAFGGANIDNVRSTSQTRSLIGSLTLTQCGEVFVSDVLDTLVASALEILVVGNFSGDDLTQYITHFLNQSACALTCLRIDTHIPEDDLVPFLQLPHTRSIVHLDLSGTLISTRGIATLASNLLHLRTLVLRGGLELHEPLLTALARHRPSHVGELELILAP